ncbi:hypothetical protein H4R33_003559 [Dimargaris cristalligena]|uniref:ATP synthase subunit K, mitochondrial n=1 Tax=Dimargaris cristalligena TaxID=215637 RepID=A0A4P9ZWM4_9FUNG|nr:hypothetical protein H4R33_003559 [Dimargaris cristalligena]RKP37090.1 hypothetical protein BJ085DRAFT_40963 [Dimargaris cristalligena]|eukprot:RKP37090.1 hypothetical protein BJ085DRAFT_40963 [Dimargaris cristalligena]
MGNGYMIFGKLVKNEYLVLATFASLGALGYAATRPKPGAPKADNIPPIVSSSAEEENFIKEFIKLAEADEAKEKKAAH